MKFLALALLFLALFALVTRADDQPQQSSDAQSPSPDDSQGKQSDISKLFKKGENAIKSAWQKLTAKKSDGGSSSTTTDSSASTTTSTSAAAASETSSDQGSQ